MHDAFNNKNIRNLRRQTQNPPKQSIAKKHLYCGFFGPASFQAVKTGEIIWIAYDPTLDFHY